MKQLNPKVGDEFTTRDFLEAYREAVIDKKIHAKTILKYEYRGKEKTVYLKTNTTTSKGDYQLNAQFIRRGGITVSGILEDGKLHVFGDTEGDELAIPAGLILEKIQDMYRVQTIEFVTKERFKELFTRS